MSKVQGFETLTVKVYSDGKMAIYSLYEKTTIGPTFANIEELTQYANDQYKNEYV